MVQNWRKQVNGETRENLTRLGEHVIIEHPFMIRIAPPGQCIRLNIHGARYMHSA